MARQDENGDETKVQAPAKTANKIPTRFRASIVIVEGHAEGMEYPIENSSTVLGRDKNADIAVKDPLISRQHAAILFNNGVFLLKDLGSTNGTFLGNKRIEKVRLRHRDKFRMGDTIIQFILEETSGIRVFEVSDEDA